MNLPIFLKVINKKYWVEVSYNTEIQNVQKYNIENKNTFKNESKNQLIFF